MPFIARRFRSTATLRVRREWLSMVTQDLESPHLRRENVRDCLDRSTRSRRSASSISLV